MAKALRLYQATVFKDLLQGMGRAPGETFTVMFPRQAGKNEISAFLVAALLAKHAKGGGTVVVCAPTLHPQAAISLNRTAHLMTAARRLLGKGAITRGRDGNVLCLGAASAVFLSGSPEAHVAGHTASLAIIADEAQELDEAWFNRQFRPMAASTGAPTVMLGTPWDGHTLLEKAVKLNLERDARPPTGEPVKRHYQVSWQDVAAARKVYGRYVEQERERLGAHHPLFLSQYELVTAEDTGRLFRGGQLTALAGAHPRLDTPMVGERYVGGLDFGGDGGDADATVLTIARAAGERCEVVAHVSWQGADFGVLEAGVMAEATRWRLERLCADSTGLGAPIAARVAAQLGDRVIERVVFTAQSKSELGYALLAAANTGRITLHSDDGSPELGRCLRQLRECRAGYRLNRQMWWEAPPGGHDDYVASLVLCLRAAEGLGPSRMARGRGRASE
ncbi:MAG: hypothetical protein C0506_04510 [Anaerolinea sp.]|nr:hypothetical protein [Anaerolinea sp.]